MSYGASLTDFSESDFGNGDFFCAEAIVAKNDDPENRCRVQCVIPIIDENEIHEIWARRFQFYVGPPGFGDYFIPAVGSEVMLVGRLGDTNNLFYAPLFNESYVAPPDFNNETVAGVRYPGDFKIITELDLMIHAGRISLEAGASIRITAPGGIYLNGKRF